MKHNTEKAALLIAQAIRLCQDFTLSTAKSYLVAAMGEINKVGKKRDRRENLRKDIEKQLKEKKEKEEERRKSWLQMNNPFSSEEEIPPLSDR